jgi:hypothetical protein
MPSPEVLPIITSPTLRVTGSAETWIGFLKADLKQVQEQVPLWVRYTAIEKINEQLALGNSKQYTAVVDGSRTKAIMQAERRVVVYFVTTVLTRALNKAKPVLRRAIMRVSKRQTGLLADGWVWYLQRGGKHGPISFLGDSLPSSLELRPGEAVMLVPRAAYAWFVNYYASRKQSFVASERKVRVKPSKRRRKRPPRGYGFMAYAARQLRSELKQIGFSVWPSFTPDTPPAPGGVKARFGVPILVFVAKRQLRGLSGETLH